MGLESRYAFCSKIWKGLDDLQPFFECLKRRHIDFVNRGKEG